MNKLNIQNKLFLVTLLPLSITALLLSSFFIWGKISDIEAALRRLRGAGLRLVDDEPRLGAVESR